MGTKYQRPSGSYAGATGLANRTKYQTDSAAVPKVKISSAKIDGDINYVVDALNTIDDSITGLAVGSIPDGSLTTAKYADSSVTNVKLGTGITRSKLATGTANVLVGNDNTGAIAEVTPGTGLTVSSNVLNISNGGISTTMLADASITTAKLIDAQVTTAKIADGNVTAAKLTTTGVTAGSYTSANITVDAQGRVSAASSASTNIAIFCDQKSSGTSGGTFTSGAWQTRTLNTTQYNGISGSSLASNQFTLPAGTYYIRAMAPAFFVNLNQVRLQNITDASTAFVGMTQQSDSGGSGSLGSSIPTVAEGIVTIANPKTFEVQHRCQVTNGNGFGTAGSFGTEQYATVYVEKLA